MFENIIALLKEKNLKITFAESCTGGYIAKSLTDIPGASEVFCGSIVTYSNDIKQRFLGVDSATLSAFGAVSRKTAYEMASGVRHLFGADIGVSVTGIAGPGGGSKKKPVGLVYIGISDGEGTKVYKLLCHDKTREGIRYNTVKTVCRLIEENLIK